VRFQTVMRYPLRSRTRASAEPITPHPSTVASLVLSALFIRAPHSVRVVQGCFQFENGSTSPLLGTLPALIHVRGENG
jgi:hypothetical protein